VQLCYSHKQSQLSCCTIPIFICSYISNTFRPDLLAISREPNARMFRLRISSCGNNFCVFAIIKIIRI